MSHLERGDFVAALESFDRVMKRAPQSEEAVLAAREGARIAIFERKDYKKAVVYLRHIVLAAQSSTERAAAQTQMADILFDHLQDYRSAVIEYNRVLAMNPPFADAARDRLAIARANFYLGEMTQASSEVEGLLKERLEAGIRFDVLILKGNILVATKNFSEAAAVYRSVMREFPERSNREKVGLQLAVCLEESSDFKGAIAVLETLRGTYDPPEYIELRVKRLQERARNQPGAKGFRK